MKFLVLPLLFLGLEPSDFYEMGKYLIAFIIGASAVLGALAGIWKMAALPFYNKWIKPIQESEIHRTTFAEKLNQIHCTVEGINSELKTNGGESLKDAVGRIETKVDYANSKLKFRDQLSVNPVFEMDSNASCIFANRTLCSVLEIDESDFLGRRWLSVLSNKMDKAHILQEWMDAISNKIPISIVFEFTVNGSNKKFLVRAEPAMNRKNELQGFMCLMDEIVES